MVLLRLKMDFKKDHLTKTKIKIFLGIYKHYCVVNFSSNLCQKRVL